MAIDKWEYRWETLSRSEKGVVDYMVRPEKVWGTATERPLNELGAQGWELVCVVENVAYFKRRVDQQEAGR